MKPLLLAVLASSLLAAGCAVNDVGAEPAIASDHAGDATPTAAGCTLLRPVGWNVLGTSCRESYTTRLQMVDGQEYEASSGGGGVYGSGTTTLRCSNGSIITVSKTCRKTGGGGGLP